VFQAALDDSAPLPGLAHPRLHHTVSGCDVVLMGKKGRSRPDTRLTVLASRVCIR